MAFCIEKFSAWFCLIFSTKEDSFKQDFKFFCLLPIYMEHFDYIILMLHLTYAKEFESALEETLDFEEYCCYKDYMEVIISKCLEFSSTPSHLRFLLMCAFIYGIISDRTTREKKCFVFAKMVSQCLMEVYNRYYKDLFKNNRNIKSFETLCKQINTIFVKRILIAGCKELEPLNQQDIIDLMNNLNSRQRSRNLNCCVQEILRATVLAAFPDSSIGAEESTSSSEYEQCIKEESSINESESEVESWKEEPEINESESDEASSTEDSDINESESDEASSTEDSGINESESDETAPKQESSINESKSDETLSKEESIEKDCESGETSSNEVSSISESESNETSSNESNINESTESLRSDAADSDDPNQVCKYCNMKCFEFVYLFLEEFMKNESDR